MPCRRFSILTVLALALVCTAVAWAQNGQGVPNVGPPVSLEELGRRAQKDGLKGTMHGVNSRLGEYVFTWWDPRSFFMFVNMSAVPATPAVDQQLAALERHQEVALHGQLVMNPSSQPHLRVDRVEPGKKWTPGVTVTEERKKPADVAKELRRKKHVTALVHAIAEDGGMLAIEWGDEVLPVQVPPDPSIRQTVRGLYRGDRIRFRSRIAERPERPLHLAIIPESDGGEPPLRVLDALHDLHNQIRTVEGALVLFPRSPVLQRSIWGVEERGPNGLNRYFTIFNFDNAADQKEIDRKLQAAWDSKGGVRDARNKYIHVKARVRVTGKVNNPAPNQANPTLVTTADQVVLR
jgi:hypothetical protein